ncbi:MAG TPA: DHH family phosphoesterase [Methanoregulaceae archaeon]|nr:MAG: DHH family phosphoesterase [Methanolinea sp.]HON82324.1 DHH family phosphoesterase [Methanoregulaceae archaeon]HPD11137.1 DHH family phosphoesterase [Methanoregulaceae archaeon]HRT16157.1 DHH family phosphoesterase [Methanoregulaceae archaeon]HRU31724.1 DHH family phosphoesterase [Methanoregulaceae archaeon]
MGLSEDVRAAVQEISSHPEATIISHIDADGISGEAILAQALAREGIRTTSVFVRQLEPLTMRQVPMDDSFKIFCDLGAGQQNLLEGYGLSNEEVLIIDHHVSQDCGTAYQQVNCLPYGHTKLAAAGVAYLVAKELDASNADLAPLAVIGNIGDMMAREDCGLVGLAREIAREGASQGLIEIRERDLNCYGISTRPLHVCLSYNDDPFIPGISNNAPGAMKFLQRLGIPLRDPVKGMLVWEEVPDEHRRRVTSALAQQLLAHGEGISRLFAESYIFPGEPERTPLRNAQEFATLLNSCGRWSRPSVGGSICRGDRGVAYRQAEHMLTNHRAAIRDLLQYILEAGVTELSHLQFIHVGDRYPDTIVGIGAGMALSKLNMDKPILIMVEQPDDPNLTKVSMRTTERVVERGIDLQQAIVDASAALGGAGGGHRIAAGAFIPRESEQEFVIRVNEVLAGQYAGAGAGHR